MINKKRSISPLIATILLIVVSVILISVVLTWGSGFAKENLNSVTTLDQLTKNDLSSFIVLDSFSQTETNNTIIIRNLHSVEDLNLIGYKLVTDSNYVFSNQLLYFDDVIGITPGEVRSLNIICFPERDFVLQLVNKDLTYITLQIKNNNYRSDSYCMGRDGVVAVYDMTTIVDDTLIDISGNGNNGTINGAISTKNGLIFDGVDDSVELEGSRTEGANPIDLDGNSTIAFCFIPTESKSCYIINNYEGTTEYSGQHINIHLDPNGSDVSLKISYDDDTNPVQFISSILQINKKYDVVVIRDVGNTIKVYINGELINIENDTITGSVLSNKDWVIGAKSGNLSTELFNGEIQDVRIYDRVLTDQEIYDYHSIITNPLE